VKISELDAAYAALDEMVQQRDEARRIACELEAYINGLTVDSPLASDPKEIAKRRGWKCYGKEERNAALDRIAQFDQENGLL
jgi:hypothetical protein